MVGPGFFEAFDRPIVAGRARRALRINPTDALREA
jgi:hypothetical protein